MIIPYKIIVRRDTLQRWEQFNPVIKNKELIAVIGDKDTKWKLGDGDTHFNDLPYVTSISDIQTFRVFSKRGSYIKIVQMELSPEAEED